MRGAGKEAKKKGGIEAEKKREGGEGGAENILDDMLFTKYGLGVESMPEVQCEGCYWIARTGDMMPST